MGKSRNLPSLNALRAFEAAGRLGSFVRAAEELHVTPGAVSHQMAGLEDALGRTLFLRGPRALALTEAGRALLPRLSEAFALMQSAVDGLDGPAPRKALTVSIAPAFASRWLMPRLSRFAADHPDIELSLASGLGLIDAMHADASATLGRPTDPSATAELSIRFGHGHYDGLHAERIVDATMTPVCSPALVHGRHPIRSIADLRHHPLIHDDTVYFDQPGRDWSIWLAHAGHPEIATDRGLRFSHAALALDAAEDGLGVALAATELAAEALAEGRLVAPFPVARASDFAYYLVGAATPASPAAMAFRAWITAELGKALPEAA